MGKCNLLIGNGILRNFGYESWDYMINQAQEQSKYKGMDINKLPANLKVVLATDDKVDKFAQELGKKLSVDFEFNKDSECFRFLSALLDIGFDDIFTTNYTYEIEYTLLGKKVSNKTIFSHLIHVKGKERREQYCLNLCNSINGRRVWHIHGEARKPSSMIISSYYYGNLLATWKNFSKNNRNRYEKICMATECPLLKDERWNFPDHFILEPLVIIGLGLDFSETDIWWLLNRRCNEVCFEKTGKEKPKTIYYTPENVSDKPMYELLRTYGVDVRSLGFEFMQEIPLIGNKIDDLRINGINEEIKKYNEECKIRNSGMFTEFYKAVLEDLKDNPMTKE